MLMIIALILSPVHVHVLGHMRAWDWQKVIQYTGRYLFQEVIDGERYNVVMELFDCISRLIQYKTMHMELKGLKKHIERVMLRVELHVPITLHTISFHLLLHVCDSLLQWGPAKSTWMYVFERYVGKIVKTIRNRRSAEASLINFHMLTTHALYINRDTYEALLEQMHEEVPDIIPMFQTQHGQQRAESRSSTGTRFPDLREGDVAWNYHTKSTIILLDKDDMKMVRQALLNGPDMEYAAVLKKYNSWKATKPTGEQVSYGDWLDEHKLSDRELACKFSCNTQTPHAPWQHTQHAYATARL
jgi:hypothetical protein